MQSAHSNRELYIRSFVADGNFKADHLTQNNADDDVALTDGEGFMTAAGPYQAHLKEAAKLAPRYKQVSVYAMQLVHFSVSRSVYSSMCHS